MRSSFRRGLVVALPAIFATGCPDSRLDELAETIMQLEATGYEVCGLDTLGTLRCNDKGTGTSAGFEDTVLGSNRYIDLGSTSQYIYALEDNDSDGAGDIHYFKLGDLELADIYAVHKGEYTAFSIAPGDGIICALDVAGEIECIDPPAGTGFDTLPAGSFVDLLITSADLLGGICALAADGSLTCSGQESFEDWTRGPDCVFPTADVIDMDNGGSPIPMVLTADGTVTGWTGWRDECFSASAPGAVAVENGNGVVCTLDGDGAISCIDLDEETEDNTIYNDVPTESFDLMVGTPINVGGFMCASAGNEVTCWGSQWNEGVTQTFELGG